MHLERGAQRIPLPGDRLGATKTRIESMRRGTGFERGIHSLITHVLIEGLKIYSHPRERRDIPFVRFDAPLENRINPLVSLPRLPREYVGRGRLETQISRLSYLSPVVASR